MKKIFISILLTSSLLVAYSQTCDDCPDDKGISTNPDNPENCEVEDQYPTLTNQFLNTFNIGANSNNVFNTISLNANAGWQIPDFANPSAPFLMKSPFNQNYLTLPSGTVDDHDFHWADGWELMYMNTGYFPNGDVYHDHTLNTNPIVTAPLNLHHQRVPYIMVYNRYSGKMRVFFSVFSDLGSANDVNLQLGYLNSTNVSGIFRHLDKYDTPMDQKTSSHQISTHHLNPNNLNEWFMSDVQLGYDPCVCDNLTQIDFKLEAINSYDVNLYGRSISAQVPLKDASGNPTYTDFLNVNNINTTSAGEGAIIYKTLDKMITDYDKELKEYKDNLAEYNSLGNTAMRSLMELAKKGMNTGLSGLVPSSILTGLSTDAVRIIAKTTKPKKYESAKQWYLEQNSPTPYYTFASTSSKPEGAQAYEDMKKDAKKYSQDLAKTLKGGVGSMSDALFTSWYTKPDKPVKPTMPTATLTEMRINGTIGKTSPISVSNLYTPGSYKFGGVFNPSAYPIYNEPVGLFALMNTPKISAFQSFENLSRNVEIMDEHGNPIIVTENKWDTELFLKLQDPLKYRFNHALDFDFDRTDVYVQVQIDYSIKASGYDITLHNLKTLHSLPQPGGNKNTYVSDWFPIEMFGEQLFGIEVDGQTWLQGGTPASDISLQKITLKVMPDMYFESTGYDGTDINSTQVFTYLIYDLGTGTDLIQDKGTYVINRDVIQKYHTQKLVLDNEHITTTDDFVHEVIGNQIFINALEIELKNTITVESGMEAVLQAYWEIETHPTTQLSPDITLKMKRDFYNFPPSPEMTNAQLEAFCYTTGTKEYQSNVLAAPVLEQMMENLEQESQHVSSFDVGLFPNPSTSQVTLSANGIAPYQVSITDVNGRTIQSMVGEGSKISIDAAMLSRGVYFVKILDSSGQTSTKQFVKQ